VRELVIVTPPGPNGKIDDATLVAARMAGVDKVFKAGGAQAIAAVAYGTETVPKVAKVIGPGSPWVAAAKRMVSHVIDTGSPAGHARQLRAEAQPCPAHRRLGQDGLARLGLRFHEAHLDRLCDRQGLSGARPERPPARDL